MLTTPSLQTLEDRCYPNTLTLQILTKWQPQTTIWLPQSCTCQRVSFKTLPTLQDAIALPLGLVQSLTTNTQLREKEAVFFKQFERKQWQATTQNQKCTVRVGRTMYKLVPFSQPFEIRWPHSFSPKGKLSCLKQCASACRHHFVSMCLRTTLSRIYSQIFISILDVLRSFKIYMLLNHWKTRRKPRRRKFGAAFRLMHVEDHEARTCSITMDGWCSA